MSIRNGKAREGAFDASQSCLNLYWKISVKLLTATAVLSFLSACGGGGGGTAAPVASTETFPLMTVYRNTLTTSSSNTYTISGTTSGVALTGSGTVTYGNLSAGTFEGLSALQRTTTATGSILG